MKEQLLAYDLRLDIKGFGDLQDSQKDLTQEEFQRRQEILASDIKKDQQTNLAERYNLESHETLYRLENGQLFHPRYEEPFTQRIKRGVEHRSQAANPQDRKREQAELEGFGKIEGLLSSTNGAIVSISARGDKNSDYQRNFVDIYEKSNDEEVRVTRYPTNFSYTQFYEAASHLGPLFVQTESELTDAYFLSHPFATQKSRDEILEAIPPDHETLKKEQFEKLLSECAPLITSYINTLAQGPNEAEVQKHYNAILNYADARMARSQLTTLNSQLSKPADIDAVVRHFGSQPVRPVMTGCGAQGGSAQTFNFQLSTFNSSPYSVSEFASGLTSAKDQYGTLDIHCQECGGSYQRNPGRLEKNCRICGGTRGVIC